MSQTHGTAKSSLGNQQGWTRCGVDHGEILLIIIINATRSENIRDLDPKKPLPCTIPSSALFCPVQLSRQSFLAKPSRFFTVASRAIRTLEEEKEGKRNDEWPT